MDGIFYYNKHDQPNYNMCMENILEANYGNITPETIFREITSYHVTGDTQMSVMDPLEQQIWVAWAEYKTGHQA